MLTVNNSTTLNLLNSLWKNQSLLNNSFLKLSTMQRINRAADDPAGLVISTLLRSQMEGIGQAMENTLRDYNILQTAEGGLEEMNSLLADAKALAVEAANSGGMDSSQLSALQSQLNSIVSSINRIANTTSFGSKQLLNGEQAYITNNVADEIDTLTIRGAQAGTYEVNITQQATQAQATGTIAATQATDATIRITGELGTAEIQLTAGMTQTQVEAAINAVSDQTGVYASGGKIYSQNYGSDAFVQIENITGEITGITEGYATGQDIQGTINGYVAQGNGNTLTVSSPVFTGEITFKPGTSTGTYTFEVTGGGEVFQIGPNSGDQALFGIPSMHSSNLGLSSGIGALSSVVSGGANSLETNPEGALEIINAAINEVSRERAAIGAFQSNTLDSTFSSLQEYLENITDSYSRITDTDTAQAAMELLHQLLLQNANISTLVHSNLANQNILNLLG